MKKLYVSAVYALFVSCTAGCEFSLDANASPTATDGGLSGLPDGSGNAGGPDGSEPMDIDGSPVDPDAPTPPAILRDCEILCAKILGCQDTSPRENACDWVLAGDRDHCEAACEADVRPSPLRQSCLSCLADNLACSGTASVRECDADCSPTPYATGRDSEAAYKYDFVRYYCDFEPGSELPPLVKGADTAAGDCALLCEKVVGCQQRFPVEEESCDWIRDRDREYCQTACQAEVKDNALYGECVACVADDLACGSGAPSGCNPDCSPTHYKAARSALYPYWAYYCDLLDMYSPPDGGDCGPDGFPLYSANGSNVSGFADGSKLGLIAHDVVAPTLYSFDGTSLVTCESSAIEGSILATATFEGSPVFLTNEGLYRKTGTCTVELLKQFSPALEFSCCLYPEAFLTEYDGRLFFRGAATSAEDQELWAFSVATGEIEIFDRIPDSEPARQSGPSEGLVFAGNLLFTAQDPASPLNRALFRYDGIDFTKVMDGATYPSVVGDYLYVVVDNQVWRIDDTFKTDLVFAAPNWIGTPLGAVGPLVFAVDGYSALYELSSAGSSLVGDLLCASGQPDRFVTAQGKLYWSCDGRLGMYDPVAKEVTSLQLPRDVRVTDLSPLVGWEGGLLFVGGKEEFDESVWPVKLDGTGPEPWNWSFADEEAKLIADLNPGYTVDCD